MPPWRCHLIAPLITDLSIMPFSTPHIVAMVRYSAVDITCSSACRSDSDRAELSDDCAEGLHGRLKPGDLKRCRNKFTALDRLEQERETPRRLAGRVYPLSRRPFVGICSRSGPRLRRVARRDRPYRPAVGQPVCSPERVSAQLGGL